MDTYTTQFGVGTPIEPQLNPSISENASRVFHVPNENAISQKISHVCIPHPCSTGRVREVEGRG